MTTTGAGGTDATTEPASPKTDRGWALIHPLVIGAVITAWAFVRDMPFAMYGEEVWDYWWRLPHLSPLEYLFTSANGYLQVWARATFLLAWPFGDYAPIALRLISSVGVGAFAGLLVSDRMAAAIPSRTVRVLAALSLMLFPLVEVRAPFIQTLNGQWWIGLAVLLVALSPRRRFDVPLMALAGLLSPVALVVAPVFRDRRGLALLASAPLHVAAFLASPQTPIHLPYLPDPWLPLVVGTIVLLAVAPLPWRTRAGFPYLGLVWMYAGSMRLPTHGEDRYLLALWMGATLAGISVAVAGVGWLRLRLPDVAGHQVAIAARARGNQARTGADGGPNRIGVRG